MRCDSCVTVAVLRLGPVEATLDGASDGLPVYASVDALAQGSPQPRGLALWAVAVELETRREFARAGAIEAATIDAVRRDFLPSGPLLDIPVQVSRALEQRRATRDYGADRPAPLDLLHRSAAPLAANAQALRALVLQPESGLTIELELADFNVLEGLLDTLRASGLPVRVPRSGTEPGGR